MAIKKAIVDELLKDADPKKVFSSEGCSMRSRRPWPSECSTRRWTSTLHSEATGGAESAEKPANHRNGYSKNTVITDTSQVELEIPRDRRGTFEPQAEIAAVYDIPKVAEPFVGVDFP